MIPYIAILLLLIAIILWQVLRQSESFLSGPDYVPVVLTDTSTNQDVLNNFTGAVAKFYELKSMYVSKSFVPKISGEEAELLGFSVVTEGGKKVAKIPVTVDMMITKLNEGLKSFETELTGAQQDMATSKRDPNARFVDNIYGGSATPSEAAKKMAKQLLDAANQKFEFQAKKFKVYQDVYNRQYPPPPPPKPCPTQMEVKAAPPPEPIIQQIVCERPDITSTVSNVFTRKAEETLTKNIISQLKDQLHVSDKDNSILSAFLPRNLGIKTYGITQLYDLQSTNSFDTSGARSQPYATTGPNLSQYMENNYVPSVDFS